MIQPDFTVAASPMQVLADDLWFPEGPVWMPDGSIVLVEIRRGTLTRVMPDGRKHIIAQLGGGPNGAALGPDGKFYVCNNGGFAWGDRRGSLAPVGTPADYRNGRIERVDPETGRFEVLYDQVDGRRLNGPNDLVFDAHGGFWFTDLGKTRERDTDIGRVCYARADGSLIREVIFPISRPNGVGLSPDGRTLYVAETETARLWSWEIAAPGQLAPSREAITAPHGGRLVFTPTRFARFDSLAVEANGFVCVATLELGGISVCAPDGSGAEFIATGDHYTTNICFGGPDMRQAWLTLSGKGQLARMDWPRAGLKLAHD
jgi:gluconolactonase